MKTAIGLKKGINILKKNIKIWGMSYGVVGDLVMGLPLLTYFEKKYPESYKYWVIEGKCAAIAPIYFNHPLIDRIKITDEWSSFGPVDKKLMDECHFVANTNPKHDRYDWYNIRSCIEETAILAGIDDIKEVLTEDEMKPQLVKWFKTGFDNPQRDTYSRTNEPNLEQFKNSVAIWPFATGGYLGRSPSPSWWAQLINLLVRDDITVYHYGRSIEPPLSTSDKYLKCTSDKFSFFQQIKASLASNLVIGTDSGPMWVMGAYSHPAINLITNYMLDHGTNPLALAPINDNGINIFAPYRAPYGCDIIDVNKLFEMIKERISKLDEA